MIRILILAMSVVAAQGLAYAQSAPPNPGAGKARSDMHGAVSQPSLDELQSTRTVQTAGPSPKLSAPCTNTVSMVVGRPSTSSQKPDAPFAYVPLSGHCKFEAFWRQTYSPFTFASAAFEA